MKKEFAVIADKQKPLENADGLGPRVSVDELKQHVPHGNGAAYRNSQYARGAGNAAQIEGPPALEEGNRYQRILAARDAIRATTSRNRG